MKHIYLISIIFAILGCTDNSVSSNPHSSSSISSSSQQSSLPEYDNRVVAYKISSPSDHTADPWVEELTNDSLKVLFPNALSTNAMDNSCTYLVVGTNHMEGLSYYILSSATVNSDTLTLHNIHPDQALKCMYPQSIDSHLILLCDKTGTLKDRIVVKSDKVYDTKSECSPSPFSSGSDSLIQF